MLSAAAVQVAELRKSADRARKDAQSAGGAASQQVSELETQVHRIVALIDMLGCTGQVQPHEEELA